MHHAAYLSLKIITLKKKILIVQKIFCFRRKRNSATKVLKFRKLLKL